MIHTPIASREATRTRLIWLALALGLGVFSYVILLTYHNIADGDLWGRLVLGAYVYHTQSLPAQDFLAYTPVLPFWIDHETGSSLVFYACLKWFGPAGLMSLKVITALATLGFGLVVAGWRCPSWPTRLLCAIPCAWAILPGFVPVVRCHVFTYALFALCLLCLEAIRRGNRWAGFGVVATILVWVNFHGGVAAGLGVVALYTLHAFITGVHRRTLLIVSFFALLATCVTPHGPTYWATLLPALRHTRPTIVEWKPLPLWEIDCFLGFRLLCVMVVIALIAGWRQTSTRRDTLALVLLIVTVTLGWRHRRHAPFFGIATLMIIPPFAKNAMSQWMSRFPSALSRPERPALCLTILMTGIALWVSKVCLPEASFQILAPRGFYPVREVDILQRAGISGNVAVPFRWGSYVAWRLYPLVRVAIDGRYEVVYPETSYCLTADLYGRHGTAWDRLLTDYPTDFIILEKRYTPLTTDDLNQRGFSCVWDGPVSSLYARHTLAERLRNVATCLPNTTTAPLDRAAVDAWKENVTIKHQITKKNLP